MTMLFKSLIKPIFILIFILLRVNTYAQYSTDESALMKFYKEKAKTYLLKELFNYIHLHNIFSKKENDDL